MFKIKEAELYYLYQKTSETLDASIRKLWKEHHAFKTSILYTLRSASKNENLSFFLSFFLFFMWISIVVLSPDTVLMSVGHVAVGDLVYVNSLCSQLWPCWLPWPVLPRRALIVSRSCAAAEGHVDVGGLYCRWRPCWGPIAHADTRDH